MNRWVRGVAIMAGGSLFLIISGCGSPPSSGGSRAPSSVSESPFTSSPSASVSFPGPSGTSEPDEQLPTPGGPFPSQSAVAPSPVASQPPTGSCNSPALAHVWDPSRLVTLSSCITVSGTIAGVNVSHDGDFHVLVRLDAGQTCSGGDCLNSVNMSNSYGDLVVEVICAVPAGVAACNGYTNTLNPPPVGSHTNVTGPWVMDKSTGWNEIHPVTSF